MKKTGTLLTNQALALATVGLCVIGLSAVAQTVQHLSVTQPGGMPGLPIMTGIEKTTNGVTVMWDGPSGYYQVLRKGSLTGGNWQPVGGPNLTRAATITGITSNAFFRVSGPSPRYAGAQACIECHGNIHTTEMDTRHAHAFETLKQIQQHTNVTCLPCHTVGFGLPTGFVITNKSGILSYSTNLTGVQCENCHGPAANHAANEFDLTVRPRVEIAATVCGGCHSVEQHPAYTQWKTSGHATVTEQNMNPNSCGRCHIGSARIAMVKNDPVPQNDRNMAVECAVCHDPHSVHVWTNVLSGTVYTNQLRNPVSSTNDYFLTTSDNFTNKYNPNINVCAQCHNHRGAAWTTTDRAPHHSPQYNFLLGSVGELTNGPATFSPAAHAGLPSSAQYSFSGTFYLTNQCVSCHMQGDPAPSGDHSHTFTVDSFDVCMNCHVIFPGFDPVNDLMVPAVSNQVYELKFYLDLWAETKAPSSLRTNGVVAWEYTNPGGLIWQTNSSGGVVGWMQADEVSFKGPDTAGQALVPDNIKKARFNLYIVLNDGSYGIHNRFLVFNLLDAATSWVQQEFDQ